MFGRKPKTGEQNQGKEEDKTLAKAKASIKETEHLISQCQKMLADTGVKVKNASTLVHNLRVARNSLLAQRAPISKKMEAEFTKTVRAEAAKTLAYLDSHVSQLADLINRIENSRII